MGPQDWFNILICYGMCKFIWRGVCVLKSHRQRSKKVWPTKSRERKVYPPKARSKKSIHPWLNLLRVTRNNPRRDGQNKCAPLNCVRKKYTLPKSRSKKISIPPCDFNTPRHINYVHSLNSTVTFTRTNGLIFF